MAPLRFGRTIAVLLRLQRGNWKICKCLAEGKLRNANLQSHDRASRCRPIALGRPDFGKLIMPNLPVPVITVGLLVASNLFMTFAWYGHLKFKAAPLIVVILVSWGIAFFEYLLQVPANRIGSSIFSAAQLKTIQEVITLSVFAVFSVIYLKEPLTWNIAIGFAFIAIGAFFIFHKVV
jgi:uncharacterized protein